MRRISASGGRSCISSEDIPVANPPFYITDSKGWPIPLQALSLPELSGVLEDRVHEMGKSLGM